MKPVRFAFLWWRALTVGLLAGCFISTNVLTRPAAGAPNLRPSPLSAAPAAFQSGTTVKNVGIPTANSGASNITTGPDGNFWFTETNGNKIGQVTGDGVIKEFPLPTPNSQPFGITSGPDESLWFTEQGTNKIGTITLNDGTVTEYSIPTANSKPTGIATGSDGALWFTENAANKIGRITTSGSVTEFPIATGGSGPSSITQGSDGNMWFTEINANKIARIIPSGALTEFPIPTANSGLAGLTAALDGNLYVAEKSVDKIGVVTPAGSISETPLFSGTHPTGIAAGTNGSIYAVLQGTQQVLKFTPPGGFSDTAVGGDITGITVLDDKTRSAGIIAGVSLQSNTTTIIEDHTFASQIEFTKTLANPPIELGSDAIYDIRVKNNSSNTLKKCFIIDSVQGFPSPLGFDDQEGWRAMNESGATIAPSTDLFSLAPFEEKLFTIVLSARATGPVTNQADFVIDHILVKASVTHNINPASVFSFSVPQASQPTAAGQTATFTVNLNPPQSPGLQALDVKPDATNVNLSASVFPATGSITTNFSPNPAAVPGSTILNVSTTSNTPVGTYTITITGTAGSVTQNAIVTLTVTAPGPDFALGFDSPTISAQAGSKAKVKVNINRTGGFTGSVTVTPPHAANGIKPKPPDPIATSDATVTFKMKIGGGVAPGNYPLTFTAQDSSGKTHTGTVTLVVQ